MPFEGRVMGGQQPITGATIAVWQVGTSGYGAGATKMATTTTDSTGSFSFAANAYTCTSDNAPMYITSQGGDAGAGTNVNEMILAVIGPCTAARSSYFVVNEVSTAAAAVALAPFASTALGSGATPLIGATCSGCASGVFNAGLVAAMNETIPALIYPATGQTVATHTVGSLTVTTEAAKINSIANTLAACVNSSGQTSTTETRTNCGKLFSYTNATSASTRPYNTWQAALMMARYPYNNVTNLYNLATTTAPFVGLSSTPNDWTVAIGYASTAFGLGVDAGTSSSISVDAYGSVWFPTNKSSAHGVGYFDPSSQSFHGPYATAATHPQYVAVDNKSTASVFANDGSAARIASTPVDSPGAGTSYGVGDSTSISATGPLFVDNGGNVSVSGVNSSAAYNYVMLAGGSSMQRASTSAFSVTPTSTIGFAGSIADYGWVVGTGSGTSLLGLIGNCYLQYIIGGSPLNLGSVVSSLAMTYSVLFGSCSSGGVALLYNSASSYDYLSSSSSANMICSYRTGGCASYNIGLNAPMGVAVDGSNRLWIANSGDASLSVLQMSLSSSNQTTYSAVTSSSYQHGKSYGGTATTPYSVAIDASGNVWMSNAGCTTTGCSAGAYTLTEVVGVATPVVTPYSTMAATAAFSTSPTR
ncbi:hypothetical protein ACFQBQ_10135 [Granulicella cerasi]|uniref:Uncharacterized protein n=1 Tax=Granulicella cerasi TaxID=741063 RepID=A0ABW1ZAK6_9BACT|nr:hypothetical protein [Granulicella cerasi]